MKTIRQSGMIVILLLFISSCASSTATIPTKYNLDDQLEKVSNISRFGIISWDKVDKQSFILQTGGNDYYLIILECTSHTLPSANTIHISDDRSLIWPFYSNVVVNDDGWEDSYIINRIYRFRDFEQVETIRTLLLR
jgi:hypothetical protein